MSLPRPTGLKPPSKIGKPSGLPQPRSSGTGIPTPSSASKAQSAIAKSARAAGLPSNIAEKYAADIVQQLPGPDLPPPPPDDDFIVGDRVWVSGTKPGYIAYIGETQFASGDWAGVVLDKPEGKNDGSVQGVRYFQCEPKRGVFARVAKLSRTPGVVSATPKLDDASSEGVPSSNVRTANGSMSQTLPHQARPTTPKLSATRGLSTSSSSLNKAAPPVSNLTPKSTPAAGAGKQLRIGDRVLVSGTKTGTLRYIGATDFAKGEWAGVELDEKQGKNDGAVAGKRYFDCLPMHGLFAPVHKVTKLASGSAGHVMSASTPSPQTRSLVNTGLRLSRERSGSQESVSSISSTASSVSRSRVRLGVNSLHNQLPLRQKRKQQLDSPAAKTSQRPSTLNLTATTQALQKALKEKEEHIEQLLRERDLERAEVARAAAQVDEAEGQLMSMRQEQDRERVEAEETHAKLKTLVASLEQEKKDLSCKLEDEKRKVEDLQFQIEEEAITKDDLESRTEEEEAQLRELQRDLKKEKERADKYEQEFYTVKAMLSDKTERLESTEEMNVSYLDQIEELTHKLSQAESTVKNYESTRLEEGAKNSQVSIELVEKSNRVNELEEVLLNRNREIKDLQERIREVEEELNSSKHKKNKMQETIENLTSQLTSRDETSNHLTSEIQNLKSQLSDLQRRLDASNDNNQHLNQEKQQLEQQMSEMMKNSGDSSKRLSMLNDQVQEKNRKIQDLQAALSNSTQQLGKLNDEIENLKQATIRERENLVLKNEENVKKHQSQLEDLQKELSKANAKMQQMSENHKKEKDDSLGRKIHEIEELKKQLQQSIEEQEKQEVQTQAHKQVLEKITMEKEALQYEKEKAEKQVKRLESEKETLNADLIHAKVEVSKVQGECEKVNNEKKQLLEQLQDEKLEMQKLKSLKEELHRQVTDITADLDKHSEERDTLRRDAMETKVTLQQKDLLIEELQKEVEKMKSEVQHNQETIMQMSVEETTSQKLQSQLEDSKKQAEELQRSMHEIESERDSMRAQLEFSNLVAEEKRRLEDQNQQLSLEAEKEAESHRKEKEELENANVSLRGEVDNVKSQLNNKNTELESLKKQIANLKNENVSLESYRTSVQKLERERVELQEKVSRLETSLTEAKTVSPNMNSIANSESTAEGKLQEEKIGLQGQVDFLNSVIVDLQQKNKDLGHKIEILESGVLTNGDHDSSLEAEPPKSRAPPRLFCDICDVFDQHDTDDCPLQAMDYDEGPSPTHYHGDRKANRPYCDICEEFHEPCSEPGKQDGVPEIVLSPATSTNGWKNKEPSVVYHSSSETVEIGANTAHSTAEVKEKSMRNPEPCGNEAHPEAINSPDSGGSYDLQNTGVVGTYESTATGVKDGNHPTEIDSGTELEAEGSEASIQLMASGSADGDCFKVQQPNERNDTDLETEKDVSFRSDVDRGTITQLSGFDVENHSTDDLQGHVSGDTDNEGNVKTTTNDAPYDGDVTADDLGEDGEASEGLDEMFNLPTPRENEDAQENNGSAVGVGPESGIDELAVDMEEEQLQPSKMEEDSDTAALSGDINTDTVQDLSGNGVDSAEEEEEEEEEEEDRDEAEDDDEDEEQKQHDEEVTEAVPDMGAEIASEEREETEREEQSEEEEYDDDEEKSSQENLADENEETLAVEGPAFSLTENQSGINENRQLSDSAVGFDDTNGTDPDDPQDKQQNIAGFLDKSSHRDSGIVSDNTDIGNYLGVANDNTTDDNEGAPGYTGDFFPSDTDKEADGKEEESGTSVDDFDSTQPPQSKMEDSCRVS